MLRGDTVARDLLAELIRGAVDDTVKQQLMRRAQEPVISSKIASTLEARLDGYELNGYIVTVIVQDFPDRGPNSWEHKSGADLYVGIRVEPPLGLPPVAKGLLIQSKKTQMRGEARSRQARVKPATGKAHDVVLEQCGKMVRLSDKGSFVWIYGAGGTQVVPASEVLSMQSVPPELVEGRNVSEQFRDVLDCFSGDTALIGKDIFESDTALGNFLEEIAVQRGVTINIAADRERWR